MAVLSSTIGPVVSSTTGTLVTDSNGAAAGEFLLLFAGSHGPGVSVDKSAITGWTELDWREFWFLNADTRILYREADGSSLDAPTLTADPGTTSDTTEGWSAQILGYSGVDTADPLQILDGTNGFLFKESSSDAADTFHLSATATSDGSMAVLFGDGYLGESGPLSITEGFTFSGEKADSAGSFWTAYKSVNNAEASGAALVSSSSGIIRIGLYTIILKPSAGGGGSTVTGSGSPTAQSATASGSGTVVSITTGSGTVQAQNATTSGSGSVAGSIAGSGSAQAQSASVAGSGLRGVIGSGSPTTQSATVTGSGSVVAGATNTGSGSLAANDATVSGSGTVSKVGTGAVQAQSSGVSGTGIVGRVGSGALSANDATVSGTDAPPFTGFIIGNVAIAPLLTCDIAIGEQLQITDIEIE